MLCPRCQCESAESREDCPSCGVIFSKYRVRPAAPSPDPQDPGQAPEPALAQQALTWLWERMFQVAPTQDPALAWVQAGFLALLTVWWVKLLFVPYQGEALGGSVLHLIHLPFHEAGHFCFQPFGEFVHILGGTLGQLLVPLLVAGVFLRETNPFGAAVASWWLGQSFMDCAPYINDARERTLMLLSGETGQEDWEGHDWYQLLSRTGLLEQDHALARACWLLGAALMLAALAWGAFVLWRQLRPGAAQAS